MQTKFLLAHRSFIVLKGLSSVINGLDFLASIRFCSSVDEFAQCAGEEDADVIIASDEFLSGFSFPETAAVVILADNVSADDIAVLGLEDSQDTIIAKIKQAVFQQKAVQDKDAATEELSPREKDIVTQVALGLTNQEIADKLYISSHTVITHRKNIVRKLGIKTVSGLTVYAILNNLIRMDEIDLA